MMKTLFLSLILFIQFCVTGYAQELKSSANAEPKATFEVTINGKQYTLSEGEELSLDTLLKPKLSIKLSDYKLFDNASISFKYPRHLSYDFSQDFAYKNWTLSGNTAVVLIFELDAQTTISTLIEEMVKKFGKKNCRVEDTEKELGKRLLTGKKLYVSLVGQNLVLECLEIKSADFKSKFIYFQDTIENDKNSLEYEKVYKMINSSIVYK